MEQLQYLHHSLKTWVQVPPLSSWIKYAQTGLTGTEILLFKLKSVTAV